MGELLQIFWKSTPDASDSGDAKPDFENFFKLGRELAKRHENDTANLNKHFAVYKFYRLILCERLGPAELAPAVKLDCLKIIDNAFDQLELGFATQCAGIFAGLTSQSKLKFENLIKERTQSLQNEVDKRTRLAEQLKLAAVAAEAAHDAKTQFLANMSHELRTPLDGILGMAQLALNEELSSDHKEYWDIVHDCSRRLLRIINNLLELANVESGLVEPKIKNFNIRELVSSIHKTFFLRARMVDLEFTWKVADEVPEELLGDEFRLRQVLTNLVSNAVRYTPAGSIEINVCLASQSDHPRARCRFEEQTDFKGLCLLFSVRDTGIGIPQSKHEAIFESFILAEHYMTKKYSGSGLGLSISKRLADLMGGDIWVESQPGGGSTFYFTSAFWPDDKLEPPKTSEPKARPCSQGRRVRILLVDDEAVNRLSTRRMLEKYGFLVVDAENGQEALEILVRDEVDMILMDVQMPVMDGIQATRHIRNGELPGLNRKLPIVALTAYASENDRQRFLDAGMDECLTKPFDFNSLLELVYTLIK